MEMISEREREQLEEFEEFGKSKYSRDAFVVVVQKTLPNKENVVRERLRENKCVL